MCPSELPSPRPRVGVSACLLGQRVRYDGAHKRDDFASDELAAHVEWVEVCPEAEAGFGVPRPPMRLEDSAPEAPINPRLVEVDSRRDHTVRMRRFAAERVAALPDDLSGYLFKKGSPSCGIAGVTVVGPNGAADREGIGLFASALRQARPLLALEDEGGLADPQRREQFLERIFAEARLLALFRDPPSRGRVVTFHSAQKLQLLAHSPEAYRDLGKWVADVARVEPREFRLRYEAGFREALASSVTRGRHVNVLEHAAGYFRKRIGDRERAELAQSIRDYGDGELPRKEPMNRLRQLVERHGETYLASQTYFAPHPVVTPVDGDAASS